MVISYLTIIYGLNFNCQWNKSGIKILELVASLSKISEKKEDLLKEIIKHCLVEKYLSSHGSIVLRKKRPDFN